MSDVIETESIDLPGIFWIQEGESLHAEYRHTDEEGIPMVTPVVWCPQDGSQVAFLSCPVFEVLYEGTRGPGKTDALLMDFAAEVGKGWGAEWRGILFRQTYKQLVDVITKSKKWFKQVFPTAKFNESSMTWKFPTGEELLFRHMASPSDYWNYHGHAYPWIGWEELCNWSDDKCYKAMMSCSRSTMPGMPRKYRGTANPYGPGHNWVKRRFRLPQMRGIVIQDSFADGKAEPPRVAVHGTIWENKILLAADPDYVERIQASAANPAQVQAWLFGSWDITSGGMFDDLWEGNVHMVPSVPLHLIPKAWKIDRSFDWGSAKPFSVGWWAESNGESFEYNGRVYGAVRGDLFRIREWYGCSGARNEGINLLASEVAQGIVDREEDWGIKGRVKPGPADPAIYSSDNGVCIAKDMEKKGVRWLAADNGPGSRKQGWQAMRTKFKGAVPSKVGLPRETPGLFAFTCCTDYAELVPTLPRDEKDPDDVNTACEDHIGDETRYRVRAKVRGVQQTPMS